MKAKFELIDSLPKDGVAIFNYSNPYCREMADWARKKDLRVYEYKTRIISLASGEVNFEVDFEGDRRKFSAPVHGAHFVENLTGAIVVARLKNVSWVQIKKALGDIKLSEKTMSVLKNKGGITIVDDSYNATPHGFEAAINYLDLFQSGKKIVITPGIIELGDRSKTIHAGLADKIRRLKIDELILTNSEFKAEFGSIARVIGDEKEFEKFVSKIPVGSVVLLEGRIPEGYRKILGKL